MNYLILVRHGQSKWNLEKRFTGWADIQLTEKGKLEAKESGIMIRKLNINIDSFYTSFQKRAIDTMEIITKVLAIKNKKINNFWELNERHYGALTGLNKDEMKKKYGEKKVFIWRRSWNVFPPPMKFDHPYHPLKNKKYSLIPKSKIPSSESLHSTYNRVMPFFEKNIQPLLKKKRNILIVAHGNSLRALCKNLFKISKNKIVKLEIPTGNPLLISFDENLKIKNPKYLDKKRHKKIIIDR